MTQDSGWCTIESDPGVFTELLAAIGVKNVQVEELYSLDRDLMSQFGNIYGVVFLFKYREDEKASAKARPGKMCTEPPEGLFFAKQTVQNACATQAILSIVLNSPTLDIGEELKKCEEFSNGMDSTTKGLVISNIASVREAHNSFAPQQQFVLEDNPNQKGEDPFHFIAYIPYEGKVLELDGLQPVPREHGSIPEQDGDWLDIVGPVIAQRIDEYNGTEIRFNLMVVVEDPRERLERELEVLSANAEENAVKTSSLEDELNRQNEKHDRWRMENVRRRWNFVPFIVSLLKEVSKSGHAEDIINAATEKKKQAYKAEAENKDSDPVD